jgi:serine/threonine protein kinase
MVCGAVPFKATNMQELYRNILKAEFSFPVALSRECKDLIRRMLRKVPEERILIPEILSHPWVTKASDSESELNSTMSRRDCSNVLNSQGLSNEGVHETHENINFINVDNMFHGENYDNKLNYEDYTALTEDFATMHVNEGVLDQLEQFGYGRREVKESLRRGDLNHATASYNLMLMNNC